MWLTAIITRPHEPLLRQGDGGAGRVNDVRMIFFNYLYIRRLAVFVGIVLAKWIRLLED
jgi:hypothetical protein